VFKLAGVAVWVLWGIVVGLPPWPRARCGVLAEGFWKGLA
jgi:hypothetical protein